MYCIAFVNYFLRKQNATGKMIDNTTIIDNQDEAVPIEDYAKMVLGHQNYLTIVQNP